MAWRGCESIPYECVLALSHKNLRAALWKMLRSAPSLSELLSSHLVCLQSGLFVPKQKQVDRASLSGSELEARKKAISMWPQSPNVRNPGKTHFSFFWCKIDISFHFPLPKSNF